MPAQMLVQPPAGIRNGHLRTRDRWSSSLYWRVDFGSYLAQAGGANECALAG